MEQHPTADLVADYATSFSNGQHQNMMYHPPPPPPHQAQPDHVSLHPFPIGGAVKQQPANPPRIDQNYHSPGRLELSETSLALQPPDTYCNQRATNGSALAHHHYQQLPQHQQLLNLQQHQHQRQQQRHQQHLQHRQQLSSSQQYPTYENRGLSIANQQQQRVQQPHYEQQQQQQPLAYSQFFDSSSYYNHHQQNQNHNQNSHQYRMDQVDNSDYRLGVVQNEQGQLLYEQPAVAAADHLYPVSSEHTAPADHLHGGRHHYRMSVNFSDQDQIPSSQMSSLSPASLNPYTSDQTCNQSPLGPTQTPTLEQDSVPQDLLAAADQTHYVAHSKSDIDLRDGLARPRGGSPGGIILSHHQNQHKQTIPVMTEYAALMRRSSAPANGCASSQNNQMQILEQPVAPNRCQQSTNPNPSYRSQVMHVDGYETSEPVVDKYVPTMERNSTIGNVVLHHHPQHQSQQQQQQQQTEPLLYANNQSYCDSSILDRNTMQQQQRIPRALANNMPTNSRALANRPINRKQDEFVELKSEGSVSQDWLDTICRHLIDHMNRFGICVIDNFLGPQKGDRIFKEVLQLYTSGHLQNRGGLVNSDKLSSRSLGADAGVIRNDRVIWIDGYEQGCSEINNLIQTLCSVITNSARLSLYSNNGLDKIVINKRTKAHVACYPGNGTRYIKHVDNPNGDGRVITAIYYLNKNWNTKQDGGLLRMFPTGINEVANIEPLFDRVLFFWSDRRNPHEVLPAYRDRFAITVWYIGENRS